MKTIVLDFDDYSWIRSRPDLLRELKEHYPKLKVSMFTIPFDVAAENTRLRLQRDVGIRFTKENADWIQIIPHGLLHTPQEFLHCDKDTMRLALKAIDDTFKKDGIEYVKGFKAPYWLWNQDVVDVLDEEGWFGGVDPNQPDMLRTRVYYEYSDSIDTEFWKVDKELYKLHGHMSLPSTNNIEDCFLNLMKMPRDAEFKFVTDYLEGKNV